MNTPYVYREPVYHFWQLSQPRPLNVETIHFMLSSNRFHVEDLKLLDFLNVNRFATYNHFKRVLFPNETEQDRKVRLKRLKHLKMIHVIDRFSWTTASNPQPNKFIYCLNTVGAYLLNASGVNSDWKKMSNYISLQRVFAVLEANEIYLKLLEKGEVKEVKFTPRLGETTYYRPTVLFRFQKGDRERVLLFDIFRPGDEEQIRARTRCLLDFLTEGYKEYFSERPLSLFVAPDDEMLNLLTRRIMPELDDHIRFTTDARLAENDLSEAFTKLDKGRIIDIEAPLFK